MVTLNFGICKNCCHEIVFFEGQWKHHITRANLYHVPHWPAGHVITIDLQRKQFHDRNFYRCQNLKSPYILNKNIYHKYKNITL